MSSIYNDEYWMWRGSRFFLTYIGPPLKQDLCRKELRKYLWRRKAIGAMWNFDIDYCTNGPWYRCICDLPRYDINCIESSNARHNLRRSQKRCEIHDVGYDWIAKHGYTVYSKASSRLKNFRKMNENEFMKSMLKYSNIPSRKAFSLTVDGVMAAFMTLNICEQSVFADLAFFDPDFSNAYPMYALYFELAKKYLDGGFSVFDRGTKPLAHETNVDEFLIRLGFRLSYCRLGFYINPFLNVFLSIYAVIRCLFYPLFKYSFNGPLAILLEARNMSRLTKEVGNTKE